MEHQIPEALPPQPKSDMDSNIYESRGMALVGGEIRIMSLLPGEFNDEINIQMENVNLFGNPPPRYNALSYVWGTEKCQTPALVNGKPFTISSNLDVALRHFRDSSIAKPLWADAVCINQEDDAEKGCQVQMMGKIYSRATRVLIWLGQAADGSDELMDHMSLIRSEASEERAVDRTLQDAAVAMLNRPWFTRIWVLQELAMAHEDPVICCGRRTLLFKRWQELIRDILTSLRSTYKWCKEQDHRFTQDHHNPVVAGLVNRLEAMELKSLELMVINLKSLELMVINLSNLRLVVATTELYKRIIETRLGISMNHCTLVGIQKYESLIKTLTDREFPNHNQALFAELLYRAYGLHATDPRDKVFGILAMSKFLGNPIRADYNKTKSQVYSEAFAVVIRESLPLSYRFWPKIYVEKEGLPSWVPDLEHGVPLLGVHITKRDMDMLESALRSLIRGVPLATFSNMYQTMHAGGVELGYIEAAFDEAVEELYTAVDGLYTYKMKDEIKALIKEKKIPLRAISSVFDLDKSLDKFCHSEDTMLQTISDICGQGDKGLRDGSDRLSEDDLQFLRSQIHTAGRYSTLFFTDTGRVGLVPGIARKGDIVAALFGVGMPFVLRRDSSPSTINGLGIYEQTPETSYNMLGMCRIGEYEYGHPEVPRDVEEKDLFQKYGFRWFTIN